MGLFDKAKDKWNDTKNKWSERNKARAEKLAAKRDFKIDKLDTYSNPILTQIMFRQIASIYVILILKDLTIYYRLLIILFDLLFILNDLLEP